MLLLHAAISASAALEHTFFMILAVTAADPLSCVPLLLERQWKPPAPLRASGATRCAASEWMLRITSLALQSFCGCGWVAQWLRKWSSAFAVVWVPVLILVARSSRACMVVSSMDLARQRNFPQICWSLCFWAGVMGSVLSTVAIWIFEPQVGGVNGDGWLVQGVAIVVVPV